MIRHWAGTTQAEQSSFESRDVVPRWPSSPSPDNLLLSSARVPMRSPARIQMSVAARRLMWPVVGLLSVIAIISAWQWHRGWQQLEAQTARKDAHARPPSTRVPPDVMERLLVRKVDPVYPEAARRANIQGVVILDAIVAADGAVVNLHPVSGPESLSAAAMDAVRWWRFRPYRVQGEPVAVSTSLAIEFRP